MSHYAHSVNKMINLTRKEAYMKSLFFLKNHFNFWLYLSVMRDELSFLSHTDSKETELVFVAKKKKIRDKYSMRVQSYLSCNSVEHTWFLHSHPWIIPEQNWVFLFFLIIRPQHRNHVRVSTALVETLESALNNGYDKLVPLYKLLSPSLLATRLQSQKEEKGSKHATLLFKILQ